MELMGVNVGEGGRAQETNEVHARYSRPSTAQS